MPVTRIPLSDLGLLSVDDAAARVGRNRSVVGHWIRTGRLPVVEAGSGNRLVYLIRAADLDAMIEPTRGRPAGAAAE